MNNPLQARAPALWHGGWFATTALASLAWPPGAPEAAHWALAVAALPGAAGMLLAWRSGPRAHGVLLGLWAACACVAIILTGGLAGPLAMWALLPLAAAGLIGGWRNLAAATALSVVAAAAAALAAAAGFAAAAVANRPSWLSLFALIAFGVASAAAMAIARARDRGRHAALETSRRGLAGILAEQGMVIVSCDADGAVRERFGTLFEPLSDSLLEGGLFALASDPQALRSGLEVARTDGRCEMGFLPVSAENRWIAATLSRHGNGFVCILRDATAQRAREGALEQAASEAVAQNAGKSEFLANMSHELRTPLNAVIGFSDIMRSQMFGPLSAKYAEYANLIHESGRHLLDLINDLLDISKIEAHRYELSREVFDARDAVSAALRLTRTGADAARIQMRGELPAAPLKVIADARALKQIALNLIANALKFTPAGGAVTVTLTGEGEDLLLTVIDTGIGIAPDDLARLGRPYEQAGGPDQKALGAGLGLSLVRAFCELHGGAMAIASVLGEGTTVAVRLPVLIAVEPVPDPAILGDNIVSLHPRR